MLKQVTDLDVRSIRVFLAIVDAGGLSAAQVSLNVGQSTLSTQLATLEARLGYRLCARGRAGFHLTPKGEQFAKISRELVANLGDFSAAASNLDRQLVGGLTIGLIGHAPLNQNARISETIALFRKRDQAVRISITVKSPGDMEEHLISGRVQVAVGYFWHRVPALEYAPLYMEVQSVFCGRGHPLFGQTHGVSEEALSNCEWAWRSYPVPEVPITPPSRLITAVADNMEAVAVLILSGAQLGYLPVHFAAPYVSAGLLWPLPNTKMSYQAQFHLASKKPDQLNAITSAFIQDLKQIHGVTDRAS